MFGRKNFLGIIVGGSRVRIARITVAGRQVAVRRVFEWPLPDPQAGGMEAGRRLAVFLRARRIRPAPVILGLPADMLAFREKNVPPAADETLADLVRLEAENDFALPAGELILDFIAGPAADGKRRLAVFAARRRRLDFLVETVRAAGLRVAAATPLTPLLAREKLSGDGCRILLYLGREAAELFWSEDGQPRLLKHLGPLPSPDSGGAGLKALASGIRRVVELGPLSAKGRQPHEIILWNNSGLSGKDFKALQEALPLPSRLVGEHLDDNEPGEGVPALAALAESAGANGPDTVDFIHPRLKTRREHRRRRIMTRLAAAPALFLLLAAGLAAELGREARGLEELRARRRLMEPEISAARVVLEYADSLREWRGGRSPHLECLREITLAFPREGRIWANSLSIREGMRGQLSGRAADSRLVMNVLDRMRENPVFSDVALVHVRNTGAGSDEVSFAFNFVYVSPPGPGNDNGGERP